MSVYYETPTVFTPIATSAEFLGGGAETALSSGAPYRELPVGLAGRAAAVPPSTVVLSLMRTHLGDAGLALHPVLGDTTRSAAQLPHLQRLDLSWCSLTAHSYDALIDIIHTYPTLQWLLLSGNLFSAKAGPLELLAHRSAPPEPPLHAFIDRLCDAWEAHPSLSFVVLDPWAVTGHLRFAALQAERAGRTRGPTTSMRADGDGGVGKAWDLRMADIGGLLRGAREAAAFAAQHRAGTTDDSAAEAARLESAVTQLLFAEAQQREQLVGDEAAAMRAVARGPPIPWPKHNAPSMQIPAFANGTSSPLPQAGRAQAVRQQRASAKRMRQLEDLEMEMRRLSESQEEEARRRLVLLCETMLAV